MTVNIVRVRIGSQDLHFIVILASVSESSVTNCETDQHCGLRTLAANNRIEFITSSIPRLLLLSYCRFCNYGCELQRVYLTILREPLIFSGCVDSGLKQIANLYSKFHTILSSSLSMKKSQTHRQTLLYWTNAFWKVTEQTSKRGECAVVLLLRSEFVLWNGGIPPGSHTCWLRLRRYFGPHL